ncbi:alanine racemase [Mesorhizobium sp.]|uniref:alanine racemase n=1 Tax=Mesorhizobium sp. TaxID=1871066 RepID=UPI000FE5FA3E|nr:alanine racemase [Mesorhizobium sp.]RWK50863.1 MAG: alanine racemase [Mesorhizobium sp.]TIP39137.1 MAG: alanine racemase [Mesorhizobium sp.]
MNGTSKKSLSERVAVNAAPISEAAAGAILTVDLGAIRENYRRLKVRLGDVNCAGVVKADGYGLGGAQVAAALAAEGCVIFFVAHLAEGALLRQALGARPAIYVLNGIQPGAESEAVAAGLGVVINSAGQLAAWRAAAQRAGRKLKAAVQVDSGMSRLGMAAAEVEAVAADPQAFDGIDVTLVMSHLARADEPEHPANEQQRLEFERLRRMLPPAPASLANSSGIFLGQPFHSDLARPGAALYGINPTPAQENPMLPVVRLQAKIIQTRSLERGAGVGYGHIFHVTDSLVAATISLGYADGWHRRAASAAWFENVRLPFLGRVSMDSIVLDISALPPGRLKAGDLVELIGPSQTVDQAAGHAGTIGYEILTSLGHRFHRRYVNG